MVKAKGIHRRLGIEITDALRRRFWSRVEQLGPDDCWNWTAAMRNGYGAIKHNKRVYSSHRLAFILTFGLPESELVIAHKCDNRSCCNPSHLEAISVAQNNRDARERIDFHDNRGEDKYNAVLDESTVRKILEIRESSGVGATKIASELGIAKHLVRSVLEGETWTHISGVHR